MEKLVFLMLAVLACLPYGVSSYQGSSNCKKARAVNIERNSLGWDSVDYTDWEFVPDCQKNSQKQWKPQQCKVHKNNKRLKMCQCVREDGSPRTDFTPGLKKSDICTSTRCDDASIVADYEYEYEISTGMVVDAYHFPQCQARNRKKWEARQCMVGFIDECWRVNVKNGKPLN